MLGRMKWLTMRKMRYETPRDGTFLSAKSPFKSATLTLPHLMASRNTSRATTTHRSDSHVMSVDAGIGSDSWSENGSWRVSATTSDQCAQCDSERAVNNWLQGTKSPPDKSYHRSSSLKTTHSDNSIMAQGQKKAVRFADALGLDLAEVKHFMQDTCLPVWYQQQTFRTKTLKPTFDTSRLRYSAHFKDRVQQRKVCLESVSINGLTLVGTVRVANVAFEKNVFVRYTTDFWLHSTTVQAAYIAMLTDERERQHNGQTQTDAFGFTLVVPADVRDYSTVELCIGYRAAGSEHWDNNDGRNYVFDVIVEELDYPEGGY